MKLSVWTERSHFKRKSTLETLVLPLFSFNSNKIGRLFFPIPSFGSSPAQTPNQVVSGPRRVCLRASLSRSHWSSKRSVRLRGWHNARTQVSRLVNSRGYYGFCL